MAFSPNGLVPRTSAVILLFPRRRPLGKVDDDTLKTCVIALTGATLSAS
jgi:hypothetical protein